MARRILWPHMRKVITMEQALAGKMISEPLTVFDCSLISDGAAAVVIVPLELATSSSPISRCGFWASRRRRPVTTSRWMRKADITTFWAVREAAEKAYKMAHVSARDIEFAEVHDCFTIAEESSATEDLQDSSRKARGGPYVAEGHTRLRAERPIQRGSGGLQGQGSSGRERPESARSAMWRCKSAGRRASFNWIAIL